MFSYSWACHACGAVNAPSQGCVLRLWLPRASHERSDRRTPPAGSATPEHPRAHRPAGTLGTFLFGAPSLWEARLIAIRIALVAIWLALMYVPFHFGYRNIVVAMFCVLVLAIVASLAHQYDTSLRELRRLQEGRK